VSRTSSPFNTRASYSARETWVKPDDRRDLSQRSGRLVVKTARDQVRHPNSIESGWAAHAGRGGDVVGLCSYQDGCEFTTPHQLPWPTVQHINSLCVTTLHVALMWQFDIRMGPAGYIFKRQRIVFCNERKPCFLCRMTNSEDEPFSASS
jgi:hypothetical protein